MVATAIALLYAVKTITKAGKNSSASDDLHRALETQRELMESQRKSYEEASYRMLEQVRKDYESQIRLLEERFDKQRAELQHISAMEFENLANKTLERQAEKLAEENRDELTTILSPLRQNLGDFRRAVADSYVKENSSREALSKQIESLIRANSEIGNETRRLSEALRGNTRLQGLWGEVLLQRLLDAEGFVRDVHYIPQAASVDGHRISDDDGNPLRPDILFLLPDGVRVVIDAKTSLTAYLNYCDASGAGEEEAALKAHILSVRNHIDKLGRSEYHKHIKGAVEHTLMFMPNDGAYLAALRADKDLLEYANRRKVVIVSPAHLLSILNLISQLLRIDKQNRNAEEIARVGGLLYDRISSFLKEFDSIQEKLTAAGKAVEKSKRALAEGNQSVIARAQRLRELGAKTSKIMPQFPDEHLPIE